MEIQKLIEQICLQEGFHTILSKIESGENEINLKNIVGSMSAFIAAGAINHTKGIHLFILNDSEKAAYFYNDLYKLLHPVSHNRSNNNNDNSNSNSDNNSDNNNSNSDNNSDNNNDSDDNDNNNDDDDNISEDKVLFFPSSFKRSSRYGSGDFSKIVQRTQVMKRIKMQPEQLAVVTYPEAIAEMVPSGSSLKRNTLNLSAGDKPGIDFVKKTFIEYGFERVDFVYEPGQYAIRGGIVDVFSFSLNKPYRMEFFGDEIESIRSFDINTQFSNNKLQTAVITPNITTIKAKDNNIPFMDFVPPETIVWAENRQTTVDIIDSLNDSKYIPGNGEQMPELITGQTFRASLTRLLSIQFNSTSAKNSISFNSEPQPVFNKKFDMLAGDIINKTHEGYSVMIVAGNSNRLKRLRNIFESVSSESVRFVSVNTSIHEGFIDKTTKICCYTDHQIFQRYHRYQIRGEISRSNALTLQELTSLNVGDYVVHIDHGIGVFGGLVKTELNGKIQEVVRLTYMDGDTIFVRLQSLHRVSKYRGQEGVPPTIHKPGGGAWNRLKQAAKKKIKDIAADLIILYAKRKATEGFAYSADSFMQYELEVSFIYEDTPDQYKATKAVKEDMEQPYPMDRLVCGDVGFGKTEVAIRAAFKAVADGKQVAVLVPTTILALQHYKSFQARLEEFPVSIDFVSRMKSSKEIKLSLAKLARGQTDIIIGTHRLLSRDVEFKDLGLLIIDEEQRFGVTSKEKIRRKKVNVDTLTLTATPIPRTLQFSLLGARDLSVINTPPPNRIPIITEVHTFSEIIIKDAIDYEVQRGGQVFFIHNRIKDILDIENIVKRVSPMVRTVVAHGQMDGHKLEEIMTDFVDGQYDVLIATTIIESGLDIPNANTIIINQAQNFGLSELHQLRGRVGRSNRQAFCYLVAPPEILQTPNARRRLNAIEEFSDLGSGFNIAMQDLDIRGAGNLLGGEQSGFITEIGFETYQKILNEALMELHEEHPDKDIGGVKETAFVADCQIDSDIDANLPDEYVSNKAEKLRLYREIDSLENDEQVTVFRNELIDRFGTLPNEAEELLQGVMLRKYAIKLGFERAMLKNRLMFLYFPANRQSPYYSSQNYMKILQYAQNDPAKFKLKDNSSKLSLLVRDIKSHKEALEILTEMLKN
ncbi:MAG: transcription-repair coupling factor [Prevotellaceae bacterium]|nr:transcription-repair coupling factor [Prevotellaceae bacterium]